jgi:hypothetical protein
LSEPKISRRRSIIHSSQVGEHSSITVRRTVRIVGSWLHADIERVKTQIHGKGRLIWPLIDARIVALEMS